MTYYHEPSDVERTRLPETGVRVDDGSSVLDLRAAPVSVQEACGWHEVTATARPDDTDTTTFDRSVEPDGTGGWVETWTERPKTQAELDAEARELHRQQIDQAITDAITLLENLAAAAALPTVPNGTMNNAQLSDALRTLRDGAQATRAGAQQVATTLRDTIRLVRGDFDDPA